MSDNLGSEEKSTTWARVERMLLILTFLCTLVATLYSVRTARKAIEQSEFSLRPWISIPMIQTYFQSDRMDTKFEITNIGQLPAYLDIQVEGYLNGERVRDIDLSKPIGAVTLLPGQLIRREGLGFEGENYKRILEGNTSAIIVQEIQIKYGTTKEKKDFLTWQKVEFDMDELPKVRENTNRPGLWNIRDGGFK